MGLLGKRSLVSPPIAGLVGLVVFACGGGDSTATSGDGGPDSTLPDGNQPDATQDSTGADGPKGDSIVTDTTPPPDTGPPIGASVLMFHQHQERDGHYVDAAMTKAKAGALHIDTSFDGTIMGPLWGQPLYVENGPGGKGIFLVATDSNNVYALDETTGTPVWQKNMGTPAQMSGPGCGNVHPIGVTGTPVIDLPGRTLYLDAGTGDVSQILAKHTLH